MSTRSRSTVTSNPTGVAGQCIGGDIPVNRPFELSSDGCRLRWSIAVVHPSLNDLVNEPGIADEAPEVSPVHGATERQRGLPSLADAGLHPKGFITDGAANFSLHVLAHESFPFCSQRRISQGPRGRSLAYWDYRSVHPACRRRAPTPHGPRRVVGTSVGR